MEAMMTFRIADIGNEAQLVELGERLSNAISAQQPQAERLDLDADFIDAAKIMLAALSEKAAPLSSGTVARTEQQVETFLDFDPEFLAAAKDMLRAFIERTEGMGVRGNANGD
jgi:hypothetical protein